MYLDDFNLDLPRKLEIIKSLASGFLKEHGGGKDLQKRLNNKYRLNRQTIQSFLDEKDDIQNGIAEAIQIFKQRSTANEIPILNIVSINDKSAIPDIIASYLHMSVNRIFTIKQRKYELVLYTLLERYYQSVSSQKLIPILV